MSLKAKCPDYSFAPYRLKSVKPTGNIRYGHPTPKPRSGHRCVATNNDLYCFGGFNPQLPRDTPLEGVDWSEANQLFRELWKFNFATKCWAKMKITGTIPTKLASHSTVLSGNSLLTFGGTGFPFGGSRSNTLYTCDLKTLEWRQVETTGERPEEQYGQAVTINDGQLYVVGGTTGHQYTIDVHCLNLKTNEWRSLSPRNSSPPPRYRHEIILVGDSIYVFGGGTATNSFPFQTIHTFNTKTCEWSSIATHPDPSVRHVNPRKAGYPEKRRCHSLVQQSTDVFIYGGFDGDRIFSDFWRLNLDTLVWRLISARVIRPTYFHSAALTPKGCMLVYGGVHNIVRNLRTSDVFSSWLTIPKLKDISWEAVLHYHQDWINAAPKTSLLKEGIPSEYVESVEMLAECG